MTADRTDRCPQCNCLFIGPKPDFCPACHSCLHWSTVGTDTDAITVTVKTAVPTPSLSPARGSEKNRCSACQALVLGPPPAACPSCGAPLAPVEPEELPRILMDDGSAPPAAGAPASGLSAPPATGPGGPGTVAGSGGRRSRRRKGLAGLLESAGASRWAVLSVGLHALVLLLLSQLAFLNVRAEREVIIQVGFGEFDVPSPKPGDGKDVEEESPGEKPEEPGEPAKAENPAADASELEPPKPEDPPASGAENGSREAAENPAGFGPGVPAQGGGGQGPGGDFGNRTGEGRGEALRRYGGSAGSEAAVARGLQWLSRHQSPDGSWSGWKFEQQCGDEACGGAGMDGYTMGHTGLALLCFLGAGHTPQKGTHAGNVREGLQWVLAAQAADGRFGPAAGCYLYNHSIACLALAEACGMTRDSRLHEPLRRGIAWLVGAQQKGGGWDYGHLPTGRCDSSVTGFAVMALKSAHSAGVDVPAQCWREARDCVRAATLEDGRVEYESLGQGAPRRVSRYGCGMAAVGLLCHLFFGEKSDSSWVKGPLAIVRANPPSWEGLTREQFHTAYYWYYATLALFQVGGEPWTWWNERYRDFAVGLQRKDGCAEGSWDPEDNWLAPYGGRMYMTTMNLLSLEVYYRYLPLYQGGSSPSFVPPKASRTRAEGVEESIRVAVDPAESSGRRLRALQALENVKGKEAREACLKALEDPNAVICWQAAKSLGARGEREAVPSLAAALDRKDRQILPTLLEALGRIGGRVALQHVVPFLLDEDERPRLAALQTLRKATGADHAYDVAKWTRHLETLKD